VHAPETSQDVTLPLKAVDPVVGIRVVVQSYFRGNYIALNSGEVSLADSMDEAFTFDYVADDIPGQIANLNEETGDYWIALPLDPADALERCDGCHELFSVPSVFWDGQRHFACRICRRKEETQIFQQASGARSIKL